MYVYILKTFCFQNVLCKIEMNYSKWDKRQNEKKEEKRIYHQGWVIQLGVFVITQS